MYLECRPAEGKSSVRIRLMGRCDLRVKAKIHLIPFAWFVGLNNKSHLRSDLWPEERKCGDLSLALCWWLELDSICGHDSVSVFGFVSLSIIMSISVCISRSVLR